MWARKLRVLVSKMVGSSHGLIALRVVRSKLRKREETNNNSLGHAVGHGQRSLPGHQLQSDGAKATYSQGHLGNGVSVLEATVATVTTVSTSVATCPVSAGSTAASLEAPEDAAEVEGKVPPLELFLWSYPSQQLSPYSATKDSLVRELSCDVPQDSKGLRKNLRGKWKRLVKRKPEDSGGIPPELRDQLKQIYVY